MKAQDGSQASMYRIVVQGLLDGSWSEWLGGPSLAARSTEDGSCVTLLAGPVVDQPALRGILNRLWDLNLILISVNRVPADPPGREVAS